MFSDQKTFTTTAAQLTPNGSSIPATKIHLLAAVGNSGNLFVGGNAGVSSTSGYLLDAGERIELEIEDINEVWVIGSAADQVLQYIATTRPNV